MPADWARGDTVAELAMELVVDVRDLDPSRVHSRLAAIGRRDPLLLRQLVVALAAMVPDDRPASELLAWTERLMPDAPGCDPLLDRSPATSRAAHGSRSRYVLGCHGAACEQAQREYDAARPRRRRLEVVPSTPDGRGEETA